MAPRAGMLFLPGITRQPPKAPLPTSWLNALIEDVLHLSPEYVQVASSIFELFAHTPLTLCIIRFDSGEVHRYRPDSLHKFKFENPDMYLYEEGVRVIHKSRGPGVITDMVRKSERVIRCPDVMMQALQALLGNDERWIKPLRSHRDTLFELADHEGDRAISFPEFLAFAQDFVTEGPATLVRKSHKVAHRRASETLFTWAEKPSSLTDITWKESLALVYVYIALADRHGELMETLVSDETKHEKTKKREKRSVKKVDIKAEEAHNTEVEAHRDLALAEADEKIDREHFDILLEQEGVFPCLWQRQTETCHSIRHASNLHGVRCVLQAHKRWVLAGSKAEYRTRTTTSAHAKAQTSAVDGVTESFSMPKELVESNASILNGIASRLDIVPATVHVLKNASDVYTMRSLEMMSLISAAHLAYAGEAASMFDTRYTAPFSPVRNLIAGEAANRLIPLSNEEWERVFTSMTLMRKKGPNQNAGAALVDFVDFCIRLKHDGRGYIRILEDRVALSSITTSGDTVTSELATRTLHTVTI
ncbi:MAG: hypothetical protein SGPRY_014865 [Prymnesium sp.]